MFWNIRLCIPQGISSVERNGSIMTFFYQSIARPLPSIQQSFPGFGILYCNFMLPIRTGCMTELGVCHQSCSLRGTAPVWFLASTMKVFKIIIIKKHNMTPLSARLECGEVCAFTGKRGHIRTCDPIFEWRQTERRYESQCSDFHAWAAFSQPVDCRLLW